MKKSVAKLLKGLNVETPVLNAMVLGYFVLLVLSVSLITSTAGPQAGETNVTATTEVQPEQRSAH